MRVISGNNKGKILFSPNNMAIRPTTDRIKETLFNIIGPIKNNSIVLDVFTGTGSIGIEFLSRGSKQCYFIDDSYKSIKLTKRNIEACKLENKSKVFVNDFEKAIKILGKKNVLFDYIYADPPYEKLYGQKILDNIIYENILKEDGLLIIECEESEKISIKKYENMLKYEERKYGRTKLNFFRYVGGQI